jgi:hypothetical protein
MENIPHTKKDLERLINDKIEESFNLEYKGVEAIQNTDGKKKEIVKDVSSFANSAGGVIIYGIKEFDEPDKRHLPEKITPVNRTQYTKEWLEQIINSNISPKIEGLKIYPVTLDNNNEVAYVIEIPQSTTAHQNTKDQRYYRRYNFEATPMLDYEIRDIMNRAKHPLIEIGFEIQKRIFKVKENSFLQTLHKKTDIFGMIQKDSSSIPEYKTEFALKFFPINKGNIYALYINYYIRIPEKILLSKEQGSLNRIDNDIVEYYGENTFRDVVDVQGDSMTGYYKKYGPSRFDPVLPGLKGRSEKLKLIEEIILDDREITWTVYADNATPKSGSIQLKDIPFIEKDETNE